ncbi:MAG: protein tlpB [Bacteroidota bacterium]|jgi:hypothetical protein|nr:protein tlpB [Bacteroidota bacterium]
MKPILIKITFFLLSSIMGLVFLYSAYTKLYPIEPFEYTFVDLGIGGWRGAPFIARFMIGLEFFIGLLLIFGLYIRRFTIKLTVASLIFFSLYLIFMMANEGNNGNCGCFGTAIVMTPLQALIKNGIMLVVSLIIYKFYDGLNYRKFRKWLFWILCLTSFIMPHILNYVDMSYSEAYLTKKEDSFKLELDSVYKDAKIHTPPKSLSSGKHIIAFMSLTCSHCRVAAKKLRLIKEKNPSISIYLILNGEYKKIQPFFDDTKARNIDYCILNGKNFVYLAGIDLPAIYMVNNSVVENWIDYIHLDQSEIEKWLAKP